MKRFGIGAVGAVVALSSLAGCSEGDSPSQSKATLVNVVVEPAGANCEAGGQRITSGIDSNADGTLSDAEVAQTSFACNGVTGMDGADGSHGASSLVNVSAEAAGANCSNGGQKVDTGSDTDGNGKLKASEITKTFYLCDGADGAPGLQTVVATLAEPAGANCANGGQKLDYGADLDRDGKLGADEIEGDSFICNGVNGENGLTGPSSLVLVSSEPAGDHCAAGGKRIDTGVDADRSGSLEPLEIAQTSYVCNGVNGLTSLAVVTPELAGEHCKNAGQRLDFGIDDNSDGILDQSEIDGTRYVCNGSNGSNGTDGFSALVSVGAIAPGDVCASGGQQLGIGLDNGDGGGVARNGKLEAGEVDSSATLCSGTNGTNGTDGTDGQNGKDGAGGVHLVDANGADLGRLVSAGSMFSEDLTLLSNTGYLYSMYEYNLTYESAQVLYATGDCSGPAITYPIRLGNGGSNLVGNFAVFADGLGWFTSVANTYSDSQPVASYWTGSGCAATSGSTSGYQMLPSTAAAVGVPADAPVAPVLFK